MTLANTFPRGEGGPPLAAVDEECGRKSALRYKSVLFPRLFLVRLQEPSLRDCFFRSLPGAVLSCFGKKVPKEADSRGICPSSRSGGCSPRNNPPSPIVRKHPQVVNCQLQAANCQISLDFSVSICYNTPNSITQGSYIGNTTASQAVKAGSTPVPCSKTKPPGKFREVLIFTQNPYISTTFRLFAFLRF